MARRDVILGTAGHIDHGKTALVRALTGIDTDRLEEERARGISIDLGFAHLEVGDLRFGIVDVPGHERFLRNMLAGASGIDMALLVVAADDSVMPQTREHLEVLKLLEVHRGIIALTKTDLSEPDWVDLVEQDVRELVRGSFLEEAPIVRTSAVSGAGLDDLRAALTQLGSALPPLTTDGPFRLAVDRSFVLTGLGTVVTGSAGAGVVAVGDELEWLPRQERVRVRGIQSHGSAAEHVTSGQRAALHISGAHHTEIGRGAVLATPGYLAPSRRLTVRLRLLEESPWPLKHRARVRLHVGTQELMARVDLLAGTVLEPGATAFAQLVCAEPAVTVNRQPFVLRAESPVLTIGGGNVLRPVAAPIRRRDAPDPSTLLPLLDPDDATRAEAALRCAGDRPPDALGLCRDAALSLARSHELLEAFDEQGLTRILRSGTRHEVRLHRDAFATIAESITRAVEAMHARSPLEVRVPRAEVVRRLRHLQETTVQGVVDALLAAGTLVGDEGQLGLESFAPALTEQQASLRDQAVSSFESAGFRPPDLESLAGGLGSTVEQIRSLVELSAGQGALVHLGAGVYLHQAWEDELRRRVTETLSDGEGRTVSQIRDVLGTSRKFAVPLCEYLDRIGVTRRVGDLRVAGSRA